MAAEVKRLFLALWPDAAARQGLAALARAVALPAGARRVHPEDLHLTLQFLGAVPLERLPAVREAAAGVEAEPVGLELTRVGCWPRPRVAWCAPDETPAELSGLVARLGARLAAVGYPAESRPFRPHVTLARKVRRLADARLVQPLFWRCADLALVESLARPAPPRYQVLEHWPLAEKAGKQKENELD
ncbi:MAG: RNA 2',3'-cyclic phosphodiesterase [Gammaproteobacteria bacterium]|jgi:2'-5' RNA ligase